MLSRVFNRLEEGFISLLLVVMTVLVFFEVVLRFGYGWQIFPNEGGFATFLSEFFRLVEELTLHLNAWLVLFGASYGVKVGSHIGVDAIVRLLSSKARRIVTLVALALCLVYCALFIEGAWVYLQKMHKIGIELQDVPLPKWIAHSILLIGFVLLFIRFVELGWLVFKGDVDGFRSSDEAKEALEALEKERAKEAAAGGMTGTKVAPGTGTAP